MHVSSNASKLRGGCHVSRRRNHAVWTHIYMFSWCISNSALHSNVRNCRLHLLTLILPLTCSNSAELPAAHYQPLVIFLSQFDSPPNHSTSRYSEENVSLSTRENGYFLGKFFLSLSESFQQCYRRNSCTPPTLHKHKAVKWHVSLSLSLSLSVTTVTTISYTNFHLPFSWNSKTSC